MRLFDVLHGASDALRVNKLRSGLTALGIIIGVAAVVSMMALTTGLEGSIHTQFEGLGSNTFQIQKFPAMRFGGGRRMAKYRLRKDITLKNADAVREGDEFARFVGAELWNFGGAVRSRYADTRPTVFICGGTPEFASNNGYDIGEGRNLNAFDVAHERNVAVIGADVARKLFPHASPLGQPITIHNRRYEVAGVFAARGSFFGLGSRDNFVLIPVSTFVRVYGKNRSVNITVQSLTADLFEAAREKAVQIMRRERRLAPEQEDDFEIFSNQSVVDQVSSLTGTVRIAAIAICFISLLVGGIGITNIMIVSVTERTREIGVRMAIGARRRHILLQFSLEAVLLSVAGGIMGLGFGLGIAALVSALFPIPAAPPLWAVIAALAMSSSTGLVFGIYPAWRASRLDPIEALRYE
jgi:putative ABC transport system permease protein